MSFLNTAFGGNSSFVADNSVDQNSIRGEQAKLANTDYGAAQQQAMQQSILANQQAGAIQGQQGALAHTLQATANGQDSLPSLGQLQLRQATDQNTAQAAGAIASQKGINPGLGARLIAQNQAGIQQQAAGQSAMTAFQQQQAQLARQQQAQGQLASLYGQQQQGVLSQAGLGAQMYGTAAGAQNAQNAGILQNSFGAQQLSAQGALANQQAHNQATMSSNQVNAGVAQANAAANASMASGVLSGIAGAGAAAMTGGASAAFMAGGGLVDGNARVSGNSLRNDTVPAMLSPGEIVLPRSVVQDEDAEEKAAAFVKAIKAKKRAS